MPSESDTLKDLVSFYRSQSADDRNLFDVWEKGEARGDSVTPSTYSAKYRRWMREKLVGELDLHYAPRLLSLGCGNAAVEAEIVHSGYPVSGVDAMPEAIELARAKGIDAHCLDITDWIPEETWPVIYMDGVLGHLYRPETGLLNVLERIRCWLAAPMSRAATTFIASNDAPNNGTVAQTAPAVNGFHWLSGEYLQAQAYEAGFDDVSLEKFRYTRPRSGERVRAIIIARVTSSGLVPKGPVRAFGDDSMNP